MFAKGKIRGHGAQLARYLMTGDEGERVELIDTHGLEPFGRDPVAAFAAMQDIADANTRSTKPFFHGHIRLPGDERLNDAQWMETLDLMGKRLGFEGQPRIATFHIDRESGDKHLHVGWFRIDLETMRAIDPGLYKNDLRELCREQERAYALRKLDNERQPHDKARAAERNEYEESKRLGVDARAVRNTILNCLEHSDGGKSFKAALEEQGLRLANGDRRDCFVVIDQEGGHHALNKKLTGMTLGALRERLADLDRSELPGVEQAQAMQREQQAERMQPEFQPGPEQQPQRYDPLREMEQRVEAENTFAAAAKRATEPAAPIWDRDAETRAADENIVEAAIRAEMEKDRPQPEAGIETQAAEVEADPAAAAQDVPDFEQQLWDSVDAELDAGSRAATKGLSGLAKTVEKIFGAVFDFFGGGEPKLTRQQQHEKAQAEGNEETLQAQAAAAAEAARLAEQDRIIFEQDRQRQREERERDLGYRERER